MKTPIHTNALIHESSPYLRQHAHNPVEWLPWGDEALQKARDQDKLILVSIGYAACHWCHVMAHECFEDEEAARVMNQNFVCIKVDREEHPDVDHFFMTAVQLTGIQGGWPLNVVALPDGKPFWGGTYFPREQWITVLEKINDLLNNERAMIEEHAQKLTRGIQQASLPVQPEPTAKVDSEQLLQAANKGKSAWDLEEGGLKGSPKFPIPVNLSFLLHLHYHHPDTKTEAFLHTTLSKMARGGIYDHVGGGFARYSTDGLWKVPHFEKMLYDNAQLLSLYSQAYAHFKNPLYKQVARETADFIAREMTHSSGAFYSSLDADSEGEEGKYYTWSSEELGNIIKEDMDLFGRYFGVNPNGYWENGRYILLRSGSDIDAEDESMKEKVRSWKNQLLQVREKRVRPALDDKTLTSWNAMMTAGLCQAYQAFGEKRYLEAAIRNGQFISGNLLDDDGQLYHTWKEGKPAISGYLEDYAHAIRAFISLFEVTGEEHWIKQAETMTRYAIHHFFDSARSLFRFTEQGASLLPAEHFEIQDNVIPSSNSVMGLNLVKMASLTARPEWHNMAREMTRAVISQFSNHPWSFASWGSLALLLSNPFYEVVVTGENTAEILKEMQRSFRPNVIWAPLPAPGEIALTRERWRQDETTIYVCSDGTCRLPVNSVGEAEGIVTEPLSLK